MTQYLTVSEVAGILHLCEEQVRRLARSKKLTFYRPEGTRRMYFKAEDIDDYINNNSFKPNISIQLKSYEDVRKHKGSL